MTSDTVTPDNTASTPPTGMEAAATPPVANVAAGPRPGAADPATVLRRTLLALAVLALCGVVGSLLVWQKLSNVQQQLARQSADSGAQASQARATAGVIGISRRDSAAAASGTTLPHHEHIDLPGGHIKCRFRERPGTATNLLPMG